MKLAVHVLLSAGLLLIVTWLNVRSTDAQWAKAQKGLEELDRFTLAESMLHRDLLSARAGLSLNYDPLVARIAMLRQLVEHIRAHSVGDEELDAASRLAGLVSEEEMLTEQFKGRNALLHNSLAHFNVFSVRLGGSDQPPELARSVSGLSIAMLHLTLNSSSGPEEVDRWLGILSTARFQPPGLDSDVGALVAHAGILRDLLPATDGVLAALLAHPGEQVVNAIRDKMRTRQQASADKARLSQYLLYAISVVLVVMLAYLARGLQLRAQTLRRRMALEQVIAERSTGLITASEADIAASVESSLADLARTLGADRAYFAFEGEAGVHHWSRNGQPPSADWIAAAIAAARKFGSGPANVVHITASSDTADKRAFLASNGLRAWICAPSAGTLRADAILGFDCVRQPPLLAQDDVASLRMAYNAIANALNREHLQNERRQIEASLHHARRIETVGILTSGIAHNFNNVIGSILGYSERAAVRAEPGSPLADMIDNIHRAADRARDFIDQILHFGRRGPLTRTLVSVDELISETLSLLKGSLKIQNELVVAQNLAGATVLGEAAQLQQVIVNLYVNAAHATALPSPIRLEVNGRTVPQARHLLQGKLLPGRYVVISIEDTGNGMDEETLARSFEPFFTTKNTGSGLGLATVRQIVLDHGGAIGVCSEIDKGTRFDVWLPLTEGRPAEVTEISRGRGQTILVVADPASLARTEEGIAALGYEPVGFCDTAAAIRAIRNSARRFDAVLLALGQPAELTLRTALRIRQEAPEISVLAAIADFSDYGSAVLAQAGIQGVLHHPLSFSDLAPALGRAVAGPKSRGGSLFHSNALATNTTLS